MITMCDYYGMCDADGKCVGHPVKVTREYADMLKDMGQEIRLVCSPCIAEGVSHDGFADINILPYDISVVGNGIFKRIFDKFKLFRNIRIALKNSGTIFFYQVDFFFFLFIKLFYKTDRDKKIVILIYHQDFTGGKLEGILRKIYESALNKIDGVIYTARETVVPHTNSAWMPDFIYNEPEYEKYRLAKKNDRVVCLGTMSRYKQIEKLIDVWRTTESLPPLIIAGRFDSEDRYKSLCEDLPENVTVRDEVLSYEEYMMLLSESEYSILPYDMDQYKNRTSGVLLESIYCGVIPVAPEGLLSHNTLPGLGYDDISDVVQIFNENDPDGIRASFEEIYTDYGTDRAKEVLRRMLCA
ncbi:MAG: hypothetical protein K6E68_09610 [Lachnospiraceae bacterium]|nr:hypothetical protein [Lachnospiraceae bacterium]